VKKLVLSASVAVGVLAVLYLIKAGSGAQEAAPPPQRSFVAATFDFTPLQQELSALRAEMAAIREAIADAKGFRGDVAKATEAITEMQKGMAELSASFKKYADTTAPVIQTLKPPQKWRYYVLRNRSEASANDLGRQGWQLVTAAEQWLFFKRPADADKE